MKLVLDTTALWSRPLVETLARAQARGIQRRGLLEVWLPGLAFAERHRQLRQRDGSTEGLRELLDLAGVQVEAFGAQQARRLPEQADSDELWSQHARDLLIAAHVHGERVAVTEDEGPAWEPTPTVAPGEAREAVRRILEEGAGS